MTKLSADLKLEILNDHYKETFAYLQDFRKLRDRYFFLIILTIGIILFQLFSPKEAEYAIKQFIASFLEISDGPDFSFIGSIIWFTLLGLVIRYFQTTVHIERQYKYIHSLEDDLSKVYCRKAFTREGKFYLTDYPLFSSWAHYLYTLVFPLILSSVVVIKIGNEILEASSLDYLLVFNVIISICILISTGLYVLLVYFKR